tara:strand:- start:5101 stop:5448 length:348 start_codon:yes stop_codon:yes gene_type:complete
MPTKRKRKNRLIGRRLTAEVVAIYSDAEKLRGKYEDCLTSSKCPEGSKTKHCDDCLRFLELSRELDRELGIKPWQVSPLDVDDEACPYGAGTGGAQSWPDALKLRRELEALANAE